MGRSGPWFTSPNSGAVGRLAQAIQTAWDPLCGMVHGGHALLASYQGQDDGIGAKVPIPMLLQGAVLAL